MFVFALFKFTTNSEETERTRYSGLASAALRWDVPESTSCVEMEISPFYLFCPEEDGHYKVSFETFGGTEITHRLYKREVGGVTYYAGSDGYWYWEGLITKKSITKLSL